MEGMMGAALAGRRLDVPRSLASRYARPCDHHFDDLVSAAWEGMLRAAESFDPSRVGYGDAETYLDTFLVRTARWKIIEELKRLRDAGWIGRGRPERLTRGPAYSVSAPAELAEEAAAALRLVPAEDRGVVWAVCAEGETLQAVADRLGVSRQAVQKRVSRSLKMAREAALRRGLGDSDVVAAQAARGARDNTGVRAGAGPAGGQGDAQ